MASLRHQAIGAALRMLAATRLDRLAAQSLGGQGVILTFHHVRLATDREFSENRLLEVTPSFLESVLRLLRELDYDIVPMDAVPARLSSGQGRRFAAITFDDGYADTRDYALPILKRFEAPFTVYVVPGFADRLAPLWWLDLEDIVRARPNIDLTLSTGRVVLPARTPLEKRSAFRQLYWRMRALPEAEMRETIALMAADSRVDTMGRVARLCLDWAALRDFSRESLVTIGAHSLNHPRLRLLPEEAARHEMAASKARLEAEFGKPVKHFAYPVGDPTSAGARDFRLAGEVGFETAVTTRPGVLFPEHASALHALPRLSMNGLYQSTDLVRALLSGLPSGLANRFRRVNAD
ncbi:MAG: polysaccharide deacetylase family protein [Beijerinckiaceae bacterium]|jgi:peptidoglycan/xylan/chitin deacetylase (PgdA/CDA1 family)|nr:polysaccharide deacetylase family protein [Beijerinckiaceae bacterium]